MATMTINVNGNPIIPCGSLSEVDGNVGVYELILNIGSSFGYTGIKYNSSGIPDRFEVYYNNSKVADSKFVGNNITNPANPTGGISLGSHILSNYIYDGSEFIETGSTSVTIATTDIADNITEPTRSHGTLLFNKTTVSPNTMRIVITGSPSAGTTAWDITSVCPVSEEDLIEGDEKLIYCMFNEADKDEQIRSANFVLGTSPVKFYTNFLGDTNFNNFGYNLGTGAEYINDGVTWWQIDAIGNILDTGLI